MFKYINKRSLTYKLSIVTLIVLILTIIITINSGLQKKELRSRAAATASTCADGTDNNADTFIDTDDPDCHTDSNPSNAETYDPNLNEVVTNEAHITPHFTCLGSCPTLVPTSTDVRTRQTECKPPRPIPTPKKVVIPPQPGDPDYILKSKKEQEKKANAERQANYEKKVKEQEQKFAEKGCGTSDNNKEGPAAKINKTEGLVTPSHNPTLPLQQTATQETQTAQNQTNNQKPVIESIQVTTNKKGKKHKKRNGMMQMLIRVISSVLSMIVGVLTGNTTTIPPQPTIIPIKTPDPSPKLSCIPRPACSNANPACKIAEKPGQWCPPTTSGPDPTSSPNVSNSPTACKRTGCSGQLCIDASAPDLSTTCEWKEEYACYQEAACEVQANGKCGFTQDQELQSCLDAAK